MSIIGARSSGLLVLRGSGGQSQRVESDSAPRSSVHDEGVCAPYTGLLRLMGEVVRNADFGCFCHAEVLSFCARDRAFRRSAPRVFGRSRSGAPRLRCPRLGCCSDRRSGAPTSWRLGGGRRDRSVVDRGAVWSCAGRVSVSWVGGGVLAAMGIAWVVCWWRAGISGPWVHVWSSPCWHGSLLESRREQVGDQDGTWRRASPPGSRSPNGG